MSGKRKYNIVDFKNLLSQGKFKEAKRILPKLPNGYKLLGKELCRIYLQSTTIVFEVIDWLSWPVAGQLNPEDNRLAITELKKCLDATGIIKNLTHIVTKNPDSFQKESGIKRINSALDKRTWLNSTLPLTCIDLHSKATLEKVLSEYIPPYIEAVRQGVQSLVDVYPLD